MRTSIVVVLSLVAVGGLSYGQERYFYHDLQYGSESAYSPLSLLLNGGYDVLQFDGMDRNIASYPYGHAWREVMHNAAAPFGPIHRFGWENFLRQEVLPLNSSAKRSAGWPNYNLHLIGGGMTYAMMSEWYDAHGVPWPAVASLATVGAEHLLNEVVENGPRSGDNVDPIADLYLFDLGGILLFSSEAVREFFGTTLHLRDWSLQPMFSPRDGTLMNNGQYFSMKWNWFGNERWHAFYFFGLEGLVGASYRFTDGESVSGGVGLRGKKRTLIDEQFNRYTVETSWNVGVFYDRNNSLLASAFFSTTLDDMLTVNIYPGVVRFFGVSPGLVFNLRHDLKPTVGVTFSVIPGIALVH